MPIHHNILHQNLPRAIKNWLLLQDDYDCFFAIADWHALTTKFDQTENLRQDILDVALDWLACGINPENDIKSFGNSIIIDPWGTVLAKADSDNDGRKDGEEVKTSYNPKGGGKYSYDNALSNRLKGRILLQVESHGEAWYINPEDSKRYYMPDGPSAYEIMKYLSLGISNSNLNKIAQH